MGPLHLPLNSEVALRRSGQRALDAVAARALSTLVGSASAVLIAYALLLALLGSFEPLDRWRLFVGGAFGVAVLLARALRARLPSRLINVLLVCAVVVCAALQAWFTGLGIHSTMLMGALLTVGLSGAFLGTAQALWLTALQLAVVVGLGVAERLGMLDAMGALGRMPPAERMAAPVVLLFIGGLASALTSRFLNQSHAQAHHDAERLEELVQLGSDWVWILDTRTRLTYLSPSFAERTGRQADEFLGPPGPLSASIVHDREYDALMRDLHERVPFRERALTYTCHDGTPIVVRASGVPIVDARRQFAGWWGVSRNVTAEHLANAERERSKAMLDRLVSLSPDPICVARLRGGSVLVANPSFLRSTGLSEAAVVGRSALELGLWSDVGQPLALAQALQGSGVVRDMRSVFHTTSGPREMQLTAASFEWDGEPVAVIIARDITDNERSRLESEAILENASIGIALVRGGLFERVNPRFETIFGRRAGSLQSTPARSVFGESSPFSSDSFANSTFHADELDVELELPRPGAAPTYVHLSARPVDATNPLTGGMIVIAEDITSRRQNDADLASARIQAEAASRAKSAFLATMSHEIRTPLNGVLGLAQLLQDPTLSAQERHDYVSQLVSAAELLSGLVSNVLDLTKIEAGHLEVESVPFDLRAVVESTFQLFAVLGRERGLQMACVVEASLPSVVRGDPLRVRQVLANLLSNALKFTTAGGVELSVTRERAAVVRFAIHDTGLGITPEQQDRIFRAFYQADGTTTRRFGGTGLGLSICRELASRMGGSVQVRSDGIEGRGSTFWMDIPLPAMDSGTLARDAGPAGESVALAGVQVLVAEDNAVNMLIVAAILRRLGADVVQAADGRESVDLAVAHAATLDAILMDLHMPGLDGLAATRQLQSNPATAHIPVIAFSAAVLEHERQAAIAAGMRGFIAKPIDRDTLVRTLRSVIAAGRA